MPTQMPAAMKSSRRFLVLSVIVACPLLVLAFGQIFSVFVLTPLAAVLPKAATRGWPAGVAIWCLAGLASLAVCRMLLRRSPARAGRSADQP